MSMIKFFPYARFLFLIGILLLSSCSFSLSDIYEAPKITVSRFEVKQITDKVIEGRVWLNIYNANRYSFEIKLDKCQALLNGNQIGELFTQEYAELLPEKSIDLPVEVMVPQSGLVSGVISGLLSSFLGGDQATVVITLKGAAMIKKFSIPFKRSFEINYEVDPLSQLKSL